jgi:hypothetical protein
VTSGFITIDGMTGRILHDALRAQGVSYDAARGSVEPYHRDISDHPDEGGRLELMCNRGA